jgi:Domain of unknown function (DUF4386)
VLDDKDFILGAGSDTGVLAGAFLELLLIVANIGTALALLPILRRQNEGYALGFVTARVMESAFIAVGILSLLAIVTMRDDGGSAATLVPLGEALVAIKNWTFVLGPGFVVGIGNGLLLGYLMYRSGLVPRGMAMLGLIGGRSSSRPARSCCSASSSGEAWARASPRSRSSCGRPRSVSTCSSRGFGPAHRSSPPTSRSEISHSRSARSGSRAWAATPGSPQAAVAGSITGASATSSK